MTSDPRAPSASGGGGGGGGGGESCRVYLRVRPSKRPSGFFSLEGGAAGGNVEFALPADVDRDLVHTSARGSGGAAAHKYAFDGHFGMDARQEDVFDAVARDAVDSALGGFNATVFAYGQTGSGKTFTITGGAERYQDRGLIPRSIQRVFSRVKERSAEKFACYISYLEIYNEQGYDLLDSSSETRALEELPRVALMEDEEGCVHLRGLSMHLVASEEEALNLLFLGDTNRAIAETPMNMASSRSHCIFTLSLESREEGSSVVRRSKLHMVDLAGSERTHKTNASGQLFREATYINKSLHYLELVIVALHEMRRGNRTHIPYRNSIMTSVLRDSLGGNCKTSMIATINPELEHTNESISTCRFAQRVARVQNAAVVNEETDPKVLIQQLKSKMSALEQEVAFLKTQEEGAGAGGAGGAAAAAVTEREREAIFAAARAWVEGPEGAPFVFGTSMSLERIKTAFLGLRSVALEFRSSAARGGEAGGGGAGAGAGARSARKPPGEPDADAKEGGGSSASPPRAAAHSSDSAAGGGTAAAVLREEVKKLRAQVQQRDGELALLVGMVKQLRAGQPVGPAAAAGAPAGAAAGAAVEAHAAAAPAPRAALAPAGVQLENGGFATTEVLADRDRAFELFKSGYARAAGIEDNKVLLKQKYDEAKAAAELVNRARGETNRLKAEIERRRVEAAMAALVADGKVGGGAGGEADEAAAVAAAAAAAAAGGAEGEDEPRLRAELDHHKAVYKEAFQRLRDLKAEIEQIQRLLEAGRLKMQADFEAWYSACLVKLSEQTQAEAQRMLGGGGGGGAAAGAGAAPVPRPASVPQPPQPLPAQPMQPQWSGPPPPMPPLGYGAMVGMPAPLGMPPFGVAGLPMGPPPAFPPGAPPAPGALQAAMAAARPAAAGAGSAALSTGSADADADIAAFYRAKEALKMLSAPR